MEKTKNRNLVIPPWSKMNMYIVIILTIMMFIECGQYSYEMVIKKALPLLENADYSRTDIIRQLNLINVGMQLFLRVSGFLGLILFAGIYGKKNSKNVWPCIVISSVFEIYRLVRNINWIRDMVLFLNMSGIKIGKISWLYALKPLIDKTLIIIVYVLFAFIVCGKLKNRLVPILLALSVILIETVYYVYEILRSPATSTQAMILYFESVLKMLAIILLLVNMVSVRRLKKKTSLTEEDVNIELKKEDILLSEEEAAKQEAEEEINDLDKGELKDEKDSSDNEEITITYESVLEQLKSDDNKDDEEKIFIIDFAEEGVKETKEQTEESTKDIEEQIEEIEKDGKEEQSEEVERDGKEEQDEEQLKDN